jgi:hypothetical protein
MRADNADEFTRGDDFGFLPELWEMALIAGDQVEQLPPQTIKFKPEPGKLRQNVIGNSQAVPIGRAGKVTVTTRVEYDGKVVVPRWRLLLMWSTSKHPPRYLC